MLHSTHTGFAHGESRTIRRLLEVSAILSNCLFLADNKPPKGFRAQPYPLLFKFASCVSSFGHVPL